MIRVRSAKNEEFNEVVNLINYVFRITRNNLPTMVEEFPLLLNKENTNNMIIIKQDEKVVSTVNFLKQDISIEGIKLKCASIGAVCTHEDYRGIGYSSLILDRVEEKMYEDGVDILLVSGTRGLYTRRGCSLVKSHYKYEFNKGIDCNELKFIDYSEDYLEDVCKMYNLNSTRYLRTLEDFKTLINSATIAWGNFKYKKCIIKKEKEVVGYLVIRIIDGEEKVGQVIECFGNSICISKALRSLLTKLQLQKIIYNVHVKDYYNLLEDYDYKRLHYQQGALKIINFKNLMEKLKGYFKYHFDSEFLKEIKFTQNAEKYLITFKNEEVKINNVSDLNKLMFEGNLENLEGLEENLKIAKFLKSVFPIPFVWTANLNYQ